MNRRLAVGPAAAGTVGRVRTSAAACGLVALLAGCTGDVLPHIADPSAPSPLDAYLELVSYPTPEEYIEHMTELENAVAACMRQQGFEYWPRIPTPGDIQEYEGPGPGSLEYAERGGFGGWLYAERPGELMIQGPENDPNQGYLATLGESERTAYEDALWGPITRVLPHGVERDGGCLSGMSPSPTPDPAVEAIRDETIEFLVGLDDSPEFEGLDAEWSRCMAGEGYQYASPHAAAKAWLDESTAWYTGHQQAPPDIAQRQHAERAAAVADWHCQQDLDYPARHQGIANRLEQAFVDAHQTELAPLLTEDQR